MKEREFIDRIEYIKLHKKWSSLPSLCNRFDLSEVSYSVLCDYLDLLYRQFEFGNVLYIIRKYFGDKSLPHRLEKLLIKSLYNTGGLATFYEQLHVAKKIKLYIKHPECRIICKDSRYNLMLFLVNVLKILRRITSKKSSRSKIDFSLDEIDESVSNGNIISTYSWDAYFEFLLRKGERDLLRQLIAYHAYLETVDFGFKYVGASGIGNSKIISLCNIMKRFDLSYDKSRDTEFSIRLNELCDSNARNKIDLQKKYKRVLIISHQGVGDEIRNIGFYHYINFEHMDIVIDPRFETVFGHFDKYNFIYYKQSRPGFDNNPIVDGLLPRLIPNIVINNLGNYDLVMTSSEFVFSIKEQIVKPTRLYLPRSTIKQRKKTRVGFIWRSDFVNSKRSKEFLEVRSFERVFSSFSEIIFVPLVARINKYEERYLSKIDNVCFPDLGLDLYDNFYDIKNFIKDLDIVIGISSFILEMSSALNIPVYVLSPTAEGFYYRSSIDGRLGQANLDLLSLGSKVVPPNSYFQSKEAIVNELINNLIVELRHEFKDDY